MPGFRQPGPKGKMILGYAAYPRHLGVYPHSGNVIPKLLPDCAGYKTSKSGVLFTPDKPLPTAIRARFFPGEDRSPLASAADEATRLIALI